MDGRFSACRSETASNEGGGFHSQALTKPTRKKAILSRRPTLIREDSDCATHLLAFDDAVAKNADDAVPHLRTGSER